MVHLQLEFTIISWLGQNKNTLKKLDNIYKTG
jgi:hypothetical protein